MKEYTVGSLADLISGKETPNKPNIVKKQFKMIEKQSPVETNNKRKRSESETVAKTKKTKKQRNKSKDNGVGNNEAGQKASNNRNASEKVGKKKKNKAKKNVAIENNEIEGVKGKNTKNKEAIETEESLSENELEKSDSEEEKEEDSSLNEKCMLTPEEEKERESRTIFVGNLPLDSKKSKVQQFFKKFGTIETIRFRSIPVNDPRLPKKVAIIKKAVHANRNSLNCYVRFELRADAEKALSINGMEFKGHHLRVDMSAASESHDNNKAIFVGNLAFDAEEDELWKLFEDCGTIKSVRIIRDAKTNVGKGFAYVNFETTDSVQLALQLENVSLKDRELRVSVAKAFVKKPKPKSFPNKQVFPKRKGFKNGKGKEQEVTGNKEAFAGKGFTKGEKKNKTNKGDWKKKKLAKQIAPKT